jgi:ABC-type polysaccharide/polyol phosphate transport system ATPase subunit
MGARIHLQALGVQFRTDRQRRPVTPTLSRLRRRGARSWGVKDVSLELGPGESVALIGPSGSGKTTLLRAIAGVLPADAGAVEVDGRVGCLLSTEAGLLPTLSGRENSILLGVLAGRSRAGAREGVDKVKARSGLDSAFDRHASSLSAGMKARLGVATALETQPQILLLDEVHEALDHEFREQIAKDAGTITGAGGIVVAAGQDLSLLGKMCRRGVFMLAGGVQADGPFETARSAYLKHA